MVELAAVLSNEAEIKPQEIGFSSPISAENLMDAGHSLKEYTYRLVRYYLDKYNNDVLLVAEKLDIGKSTIYRYLKEMQDKDPR